MTGRQRELYLRVRHQAGRLRTRLAHRPKPPQEKAEAEAPSARRLGHPPDVAFETTNLGPVMDGAVLRAKRRMRIGADPEYDLVYENFDVLHYLLQTPHMLELFEIDHPGLDQSEPDLIEHFLENGLAEQLSPHPDFSMEAYVARYPGKARARGEGSPYLTWLKRGKAAGDLADPAPGIRPMARVLGLKPREVVDLLADRRRDLQQRLRTGRLGEMFARAAEIEPLIGAAWPEITRPRLLPFSRPAVVGEVSALYRAQEAAGLRRARLVLVVDRVRRSGGRGMEEHVAHALRAHVDPADIVVIYTDDRAEPPFGRYPTGVRQIDFAKIAGSLSKEDAQHALVMLLRTFHADAIVNVNSRMLYHAMQVYGRPLAATERLFPILFCNEKTPMGTSEGWGMRYFYRMFDDVAGVITDSEYLARDLADTYRMTEKDRQRLHVFRAPVDPDLPVISESPIHPGRRAQVFWAGPWARQQRIGLFLRVARLMPDVDFRMWGEPVPGSESRSLPPNVSVRGRYSHISEIPLSEADVWLYTSGWDGVPSQLLEVAMTGIPIVGTLVGGTGEVLSEDDAWPVADDEGAEAYVTAIRAALAGPAESRRRALALRERMLRERPEKGLAAQASDVLLTGDEYPDDRRLARDGRVTASADLTVILTAHNETVVCGPTMTSADIAVEAARAVGFSVQTIVALDNATEATAEYFHQAKFAHWEKRHLHEGDPGRVRNALVPQVAGRHIALLDADDLFSENWLADGLRAMVAADEGGDRVIAHPEVNLIFDGGAALNHNVAQDSPLFTPHFLYVRNCYDTLCLAPREAHLEVPYGHRDIANGLSREDWQFGVETMARGWKHITVPDTIIFKRRRDSSMMVESASRKSMLRSLPEMAIDRIRDLPRLNNVRA